jgi:superfamily II DNA or RNA helicase
LSSLLPLIEEIFRSLSTYNPLLRFLSYSWITRPRPIRPFLHQVEVLDRCMLRKPVRIFIGDEIGLGKTITAIILGRYLWELGEAKRVLVLTPRILIDQWRDELGWWGIDVERVERDTIKDLAEAGFQEGWYLASMDLIKAEAYFRRIDRVSWDLLIIDEAHRLSPSARERWETIGELIRRHPEMNVILLSATPHKGFPDDYLARLRLLDPYLEATKRELDSSEFYRATWNVLILRRTKDDVEKVYGEREVFPPAKIRTYLLKPSGEEKELHEGVRDLLGHILEKYHNLRGEALPSLHLLLTIIVKRFLSSPASALDTLNFIVSKRIELARGVSKEEAERRAEALRRILRSHLELEYEEPDEEDILFLRELGIEQPSFDDITNYYAASSRLLGGEELDRLTGFMELTRKVMGEGDTKLKALVGLVKEKLAEGEKVLVFTEYRTTAEYIMKALGKELGDKVYLLTGGWRKRDQWQRVERGFIKGDRYRVLVATDVASEGLNLQVASNLIIYDIPWSPIKLEQRVGRVWRLGQEKPVEVHILALGSHGEREVFTILYHKLLNMTEALMGKVPPLLGDVLELCYEGNLTGSRLTQVPPTEKGRTINEIDLILSLIKGDKEFAEFVEWYLKILYSFQEKVRASSVFPEAEMRIREELASTNMFSSLSEARDLLAKLARMLAKRRGDIRIIGGKEFLEVAGRPTQNSLEDMKAEELLHHVKRLLTTSTPRNTSITIYGKLEAREIEIYRLKVKVRGSERIEAIFGIEVGSKRIIKTTELLKTLIELEDTAILTEEENLEVRREWLIFVKSLLSEFIKETLLVRGLNSIKEYLETTDKCGLRSKWPSWALDFINHVEVEVEPIVEIKVKTGEELKKITDIELGRYTEEKLKVEEESIDLITRLEGDRFKVVRVEDISPIYDLILVSGRVQRLVEVKGLTWRNIIIYTDREYEFAKRAEEGGVDYWLYVADFRGEEPRLLRFKNPLKSGKLRHLTTVMRGDREYYLFSLSGSSDE